MTIEKVEGLFPTVGDNERTASTDMFYREEVQLASRNRGMPLEALRYDITPAGMHYLLIHFDIPFIDADTWTLEIGGLVANPVSLTLDEIKSRPAITMPVTMECAGNGRTLLEPRAISQPWGLEAIGTAEWTGTPLAPILDEAGVDASAIEILFTGQDRGVQGDEIQDYQRSLTLDDATREEVMLVYEMNGHPLQPQHGFPVRLMVPGWYGMTSVKWLTKIESISEHFSGYQQDHTYRYKQDADDPGEPVDVIRVAR
jgi:DMSO/TMAO reductase YedYZ molybdopterin-dependent catalytic subunit